MVAPVWLVRDVLKAGHARVQAIPEAERLHGAAHHQHVRPGAGEAALLNPC